MNNMLKNKIRSAENIFKCIDNDIQRLKRISDLECIANCGECCKNQNIEATVLEFLPLGYHLYSNKQSDEILKKIEKHSINELCVFYNPFPEMDSPGNCSHYFYRPLICRLFGFSARENKKGEYEIVVCKILKTEKSLSLQKAEEAYQKHIRLPLIRNYTLQLQNIDPDMGNRFYPINEAIKLAVEKICFHFQFRD